MEGATLAHTLVFCLIALRQAGPSPEPDAIPKDIQNQPTVSVVPRRRAMAFSIPGFQRGQPIGSLDPWWYGYNFGDNAAGFYGGGNYTRYYAYSRGFPSIGDYPGPVPGRVWTNDPKRTPYLHQMPQLAQSGVHQDGPVMRGIKPSHREVSGETQVRESAVKEREEEKTKLTARISVKVPVEAKVTIEGVPTRQTGASREFISPELLEDIDYVYHLHAEWLDIRNKTVQRDARVVLRAGSHQIVMFQNEVDDVLIENVK